MTDGAHGGRHPLNRLKSTYDLATFDERSRDREVLT